MPIELFNINEGYTVFTESDYRTKKHTHYAIEIVCCKEGTFNVTTAVSNHTNITSVIIPSNLPHRFSCLGTTCNLLFLDPLSPLGSHFRKQYRLVSQNDAIANPPGLNRFYKKGNFNISWMKRYREGGTPADLDFRIRNCLQEIDARITDQSIPLSQLSEASFLSESRLSHLFKEQIGISIHQCILWKKILVAVVKAREGYSLTACAHYAGFSDSAHFCKVYARMFGINPFFVLKR